MGFFPRRFAPRALGALCLALTLVPGTAGAAPKAQESKAVESARSAFYRALDLQDRGRWAEALELLEKVAETRESAQVRFNIAFNQEHLGRLATAARGYERAIALAGSSGAENVIHAANERLAGLSQRIARLVLRPAGDRITVSVDGAEFVQRDWGHAVPVEVGDHTIQAEAVGHRPYRMSVHLLGGETRELRIELEPVRVEVPAPIAVLTPEPRATEPRPEPKPRPTPPPKPRDATPNALPYVAAGAALFSLATAGIFYGLRKDALDEMHASCNAGRCPDELRATDENGALYTAVANIALATGVGLAGVSAGLFISQVAGADERREVSVRASVSTDF